MKKLAAVFISLLFASSASAQVVLDAPENSRMMGMGVANNQIVDDYNIWINPAQISNYSNMISIEFGDHSPGGSNGPESPDSVGAWGGINTGTSYGTWGIYLGRPYHDPMADYGVASGIDANRFDLFYGPAGLPVGFYLSYANTSVDPAAGPDTDASEFNLGAGANLMGGAVEVAADIAIATADDGTTDDDYLGIGLGGRHHMDAGAAGTLISHLGIKFEQFDKSKVDVIGVDLGTALNSMPNNETLVVTGIGIVYETAEDTTIDDTLIAIPVNLGMEHQTFKRVKTRAGIRKDIYHSDETIDPGDTATTTRVLDGYATVSVGLGVDVTDNLIVDWVVNRDILFSGTYLVSGVEETFASFVTGSWRFE